MPSVSDFATETMCCSHHESYSRTSRRRAVLVSGDNVMGRVSHHLGHLEEVFTFFLNYSCFAANRQIILLVKLGGIEMLLPYGIGQPLGREHFYGYSARQERGDKIGRGAQGDLKIGILISGAQLALTMM